MEYLSFPPMGYSLLGSIAYMDPLLFARVIFLDGRKDADCTHISGLDIGGRSSLLAMMESALFLLNSFSTCASTVSAINRVWKSRSDLSRHQYPNDPSNRPRGWGRFCRLWRPQRWRVYPHRLSVSGAHYSGGHCARGPAISLAPSQQDPGDPGRLVRVGHTGAVRPAACLDAL
jgi:hypothetical protein